VSDSTNQGGSGGDFRGSREEKRQDETVMINSDNLSGLVSEAKSAAPNPTPAGATAARSTGADDELADTNFGRILVILGVIALVIAVAVIAYVNLIAD
jgi:hypothetical protein